jgi:hypothetical protein
MYLGIAMPRTRRQEKALFVLRAMMAAKPGKQKKAAKRASRLFKKAFPKEGRLKAA